MKKMKINEDYGRSIKTLFKSINEKRSSMMNIWAMFGADLGCDEPL
jgi:hypothetical protein